MLFVVVLVWLYFLCKYLLIEGRRREKTKKLYSGGQLVRDGGQLVTGSGRDAEGRGRDGGGPGGMSGGPVAEGGGAVAAVLVVVMVRSKSKTNCAPHFMVFFNVHIDLFAPLPHLHRSGGGGDAEGMAGSWAAWRGVYPPIDSI